jgi:nanoRNase/pAp phosphatase (c-di-AMP/oligoRNAs hydrolase)
MSRLVAPQATKSEELLHVLSEFDRFLVVMHDNPDPDAIATGWGLQLLIRRRLHRPVRVIGGGAIVRAENRHLVELLQPPIELVDDLEVGEGATAILVDCGSEANNHLLTRKSLHPIAVIDHHVNEALETRPAFRDIRPHVAASASISASYLREQRIEPGAKLASAMIYALRTETCGSETHYSALDRSILPWLTERAEPALLAEIENAPLSRDYFGDLLLAMQSTFVYDRVALCFLPRASGAEIVGEVADLLIRCQGIQRVLCAAIVGADLVLSARTERDCGSAVTLLARTLEGLGGAGGHAHRAGGKITGVGRGAKVAEELSDELRRRWLKSCGVKRKRGTRLIAKRDIVENL